MHALVVPRMPGPTQPIETLPEPPATMSADHLVQRGHDSGIPNQPGAEADSTPPARASPPGTPAARAPCAPAPARPGPLVSRTASPLSAQDVLDRRVLERVFGALPFELRVLSAKLPNSRALANRNPAGLHPPLAVADPTNV